MKPRAPQDTPENAERFQEQGVADVYHLRLPHPNGVFAKLESLVPEQLRTILDIGTGTGDLARRQTSFAERVDEVDLSAPMLRKGREAPGGDHPALRWIHGRMEELDLQGPYGLVTAGDSMIDELIERRHFRVLGDWRTPPDRNRQSVDDYVMSWHSRGGLARGAMSADNVAAFDSAVRDLVAPWVEDGIMKLQTEGRVTWGRPLPAHGLNLS